jgi:hypothetical protein
MDYYGLTIMSPEPGSNCLGGAVADSGSFAMYPNSDYRPDLSFIDAMKAGGWNCNQVKSAGDCKCKCTETKTLITLYKQNDPKNKGKNPWKDPGYQWRNRSAPGRPLLDDIHAIRADSGCSNDYKQIPRASAQPQQFDKNIDWDLFKGKPLLCCCKPK